MTKQELQIEFDKIKEKSQEDIKFLEKSLKINDEYIEGLKEEKEWHDKQYRLKSDEASFLQRQIELEADLITTKGLIANFRSARKRLDKEYMETIEPARAEKKAKQQQAN